MGTSSGAYELKCTHQNEYQYFIIVLKHGYICFISILTRPYLSNCFESLCWQYVVWLTVSWDPMNFWINERFQLCNVTLDSTFTNTIVWCSTFISVFCIIKNLWNVSMFRL